MSLNLVKGPIYDQGGIQSAAVPGLTQIFWRVQRDDTSGAGYTVTNNGGKARFTMGAIPPGVEIGQFIFIEEDHTVVDDPTYAGIHEVTAITAFNVDTDTNFVDTNNDGFVTFSVNDVYTMSVLLSADNPLFFPTTIQYKIPFNIPVFNLDLHEAFRPVFSIADTQYNDLSVVLSAENAGGFAITGTAIQTYSLQSFAAEVPQGYDFGASLVGFVPRALKPGKILTELETPVIIQSFPGRYQIFIDQAPMAYTLNWEYLDVNRVSLGAFSSSNTALVNGYESLDFTYAPPAGTKFFDLWVDDQEVVVNQIIETLTYRDECLRPGHLMVGWQNRLGSFDIWNFNIHNEASIDTNPGLSYTSGGTFDVIDNADQVRTIRGTRNQRYTLTTSGLSRLDLYGISEILTSEDVIIFTYDVLRSQYNTIGIRVVSGFNVPYNAGQLQNYDFQLQIELPKNSAYLSDLLTYTV